MQFIELIVYYLDETILVAEHEITSGAGGEITLEVGGEIISGAADEIISGAANEILVEECVVVMITIPMNGIEIHNTIMMEEETMMLVIIVEIIPVGVVVEVDEVEGRMLIIEEGMVSIIVMKEVEDFKINQEVISSQ